MLHLTILWIITIIPSIVPRITQISRKGVVLADKT
jgi:hypothetical protein